MTTDQTTDEAFERLDGDLKRIRDRCQWTLQRVGDPDSPVRLQAADDVAALEQARTLIAEVRRLREEAAVVSLAKDVAVYAANGAEAQLTAVKEALRRAYVISAGATQGPWQAKNDREWAHIIGNIDGPDDGNYVFSTVCECDPFDNDSPEQHANARLIFEAVNALRSEAVERLFGGEVV